MTRVRMDITLPDEFLQALLQHLRDFDLKHDPERRSMVHIALGIEAPNLTAATMQSIFRNIHPPFENEWVYPSGVAEA